MIETQEVIDLGFVHDEELSEISGGRVFLNDLCSMGIDRYGIVRIHKETEGVYERVFEDRVEDIIELIIKLRECQGI